LLGGSSLLNISTPLVQPLPVLPNPPLVAIQTPEQWKASLNNVRTTRIIEGDESKIQSGDTKNKISQEIKSLVDPALLTQYSIFNGN